MLKVRVIPTLLWKNFGLVKGVGFDSWRRVGSILPAVKVYNTRQVDEMIILDISASISDNKPDFDMLADIANECFVPLTFGGGIKTLDHIKQALRLGADKIALNSSALENPSLIRDAASRFGSQCIVVSIDTKKSKDDFYCYSKAGTKKTSKKVIEWAQEVQSLGAGEILLTDIDLDGSLLGYNYELINIVSKSVNIPVIASGGAGKLEDFYEAIADGGASAVAAASIFHFTQITPLEIKKFLSDKGIHTRKAK